MFKSKLHQMVVTEANLMYEGSITIDQDLVGRRQSSTVRKSTGS
jgi:aspartate 1-decarboxylase